MFIGRYDPEEDDFIGNTFLAHPQGIVEETEAEETKLGIGMRIFTRENKRLCGFLFLRTLRTGSRALILTIGLQPNEELSEFRRIQLLADPGESKAHASRAAWALVAAQ